jgi:hypothetical protein
MARRLQSKLQFPVGKFAFSRPAFPKSVGKRHPSIQKSACYISVLFDCWRMALSEMPYSLSPERDRVNAMFFVFN